LGVVTEADACRQSRIDHRTLEPRIGLPKDERENVGGIGRGIVLADRRSLPAKLDKNVLNGLVDDNALAPGKRRVVDKWEFDKRVIRLCPVAE